MSSISKLPHIKAELWKLIQYYLENFTLNFTLFNKEEGKKFLNKLKENKFVSKYQWEVESRQNYNLLDVFCGNFIKSFASFHIDNIKKFSEENIISKEFIDASELQDYFDSQFEKLENEILLNDEFEYEILIPTFRIYFPEGVDIIVLDSDHIIKNIYNQEYPYGKNWTISKFKNPPRFWEPYEESPGSFKKANASFEINFKIRKRLASDLPYIDSFVPYYPIKSEGFDVFGEKVRSISDFFISYSPEDRFLPFTFGLKYYVRLPPFSQSYPHASNFIGIEFSYPSGMLSLKDPKILALWKDCWENNYTYFYDHLYNISQNPEKARIFRYTINTLRTIDNIFYLTLKNFLLISTLEGLLFKESIQKKIGVSSSNKSIPTSEVFVSVSRDQGKKWRFLLDESYFTSSVFNQQGHDKDLKDFIKSAFQYRNNIAHPEKIQKITFKPLNIYDREPTSRYEYILSVKILEWFKKFLRFLINTWVKKRIKDKDDWYNYLDSLFP